MTTETTKTIESAENGTVDVILFASYEAAVSRFDKYFIGLDDSSVKYYSTQGVAVGQLRRYLDRENQGVEGCVFGVYPTRCGGGFQIIWATATKTTRRQPTKIWTAETAALVKSLMTGEGSRNGLTMVSLIREWSSSNYDGGYVTITTLLDDLAANREYYAVTEDDCRVDFTFLPRRKQAEVVRRCLKRLVKSEVVIKVCGVSQHNKKSSREVAQYKLAELAG